ncbi:hypothetical protein Tco_0901011 [Tanacetum coccineum]
MEAASRLLSEDVIIFIMTTSGRSRLKVALEDSTWRRYLEDEATPSGEQSSPHVLKTAKQLAARRNQERIKSILLLAIPNEYLLKFHNVPDAKSLVYEDELKRSSGSNFASQNLAFLSSKNTNSTNEVSTTSVDFRVSTAGGSKSSSSTQKCS